MPVALFPDRAKAEPIRQRLADFGIAAEIHDELHLQKLWFASKPESGVRIEVPCDQFERAEQMLIDWDRGEGALREAIRCPECRSLRVEYPQFTGKSFIPNVMMGLLAAVGRVQKQFYCHDCHYTWPKEGTKPSAARPNAAPYYFIEGVEQTGLHGAQPMAASQTQRGELHSKAA